MIAHPVIQYPGAKWTIASEIIKHFPPHRVYVEAFGGSGALLLNKDKSFIEVYNDLDQSLFNLFLQLRNPESALKIKERLELTLYSRDECKLAFEESEDPIENACRFITKSYLSRSLAHCSFRRQSPYTWGTKASVWANYPSQLMEVCERLQEVNIENIPAIECLRFYDDKGVFFYLDPPYCASTRRRNLYEYELHEDTEHIELLEVVLGLKGMVILSGYANPLYDEMLEGWEQVRIETRADGGGERTEILYLSPNIPKNKQKSFL